MVQETGITDLTLATLSPTFLFIRNLLKSVNRLRLGPFEIHRTRNIFRTMPILDDYQDLYVKVVAVMWWFVSQTPIYRLGLPIPQ